MHAYLAVCLAWLLFSIGAFAADPPASASFDYATLTTAPDKWQPLDNTAPAAADRIENKTVLRLPCHFQGPSINRAYWDYKVNLDLSSCRRLEFKIFCRNTEPFSYFSLYFESGNGWYHAPFFPESTTNWSTIKVDKANTTIEGKPAGWGHIRTIRVSAWKSSDKNSEFWLSDFRRTGLLGVDAHVAILRADSEASGDPQGVRQYTAAMMEHFEALHVPSLVVSDLDSNLELLQKAQLVILPNNASMPSRVLNDLVRYVNGGGKIMAFYHLPDKLVAALQMAPGKYVKAAAPGHFARISFKPNAVPGAPPKVEQRSWNITTVTPVAGASQVLAEWLNEAGQPAGQPAIVGSAKGIVMTHILLPDDLLQKRKMLLALAGRLVPDIWRQAAESSLQRAGTIAGFAGFEEAFNKIGELGAKKPQVAETLSQARQARDLAVAKVAQREYPAAIEQAALVGQRLQAAFCMAQDPMPGEFRAFWCHSAFGVEGMEWDQAIRRLAENGFTAILPNMLWGGVAYYDSKVLPVSPAVKERGDQIARCLAACRKYGLQIHVWKVNWNLAHAAPREFQDRMRREQRLQHNSKGKEELWLCPSHPQNQALEIESMLEVVRNYNVDGIHFDYIRYPGDDHCFCPGCKERFERATGLQVQSWPADVLKTNSLRQPWLEWRRGNITTVVKAVSQQAHALKPGIKISAAVFRNWPSDRDSVGQDWKLWCDKGYMDFVCPMDYTHSNGNFENEVAQQVQWAGKVPCYPGIGASASSSVLGPDRVIEQINITRRYSTKGFTIFNYGVAESKDLLPMLGLGITKK